MAAHEQMLTGAAFDLPTLLTDLTLDPPQSTSDQSGVPLLDEDYLILSTIHSAKGQEWDRVSILHVTDGSPTWGCVAIGRDEMRRYLSENISYAPDESMQAGMELYFELASKHGLGGRDAKLTYL